MPSRSHHQPGVPTADKTAPETPAVAELVPYLFQVLTANDLSEPPRRIPLGGARRLTISRVDEQPAALVVHGDTMALTLPDPPISREPRIQLERCSTEPSRFHLNDLGARNPAVVHRRGAQAVAHLVDGDVIEVGHTFFVYREQPSVSEEVWRAVAEPAGGEIETLHPLLATMLWRLRNTAVHNGIPAEITPARRPALRTHPLSIHIRGETGAGKEKLARLVHEWSMRRGKCVAANSSTLANSLVDDELFGHQRQAYTGAGRDRLGLFEEAHHGTVFLDEIGDLPLDTQTKLLRVLQERQVKRLGANALLEVEFQLVSATNKDLMAEVKAGRFREDLYYRITNCVVEVPPLRERQCDFGLILRAILRRSKVTRGITAVTDEAARALLLHDWPGNIRELESAITGSAIEAGAKATSIEWRHLAEPVRAALHSIQFHGTGGPAAPRAERPEQSVIEGALRQARGNMAQAARLLETSRENIRRWCKHYGIDPLLLQGRE